MFERQRERWISEAPSLVVACWGFFLCQPFSSLVGISISVQKRRATPSLPLFCIFSHLKSSAEYQESHQLSVARTEESRESSVCEFDHCKRAGNCHIPSPVRIAVLLEGQGAGEEMNIQLCYVHFPKWKRQLDKVT